MLDDCHVYVWHVKKWRSQSGKLNLAKSFVLYGCSCGNFLKGFDKSVPLKHFYRPVRKTYVSSSRTEMPSPIAFAYVFKIYLTFRLHPEQKWRFQKHILIRWKETEHWSCFFPQINYPIIVWQEDEADEDSFKNEEEQVVHSSPIEQNGTTKRSPNDAHEQQAFLKKVQ